MIYLDNNATTLIDPRVVEVMQTHLSQMMGNPSSLHQSGQRARQLLFEARGKIAELLDVKSEALCFTSSATEAINWLLSPKQPPKHIISSHLEHPATIAALERLKAKGSRLSYLAPLEGKGAISTAQIESVLCDDTELIVIMATNNETGVKSDITAIAALAKERGIYFVVDGVALYGKEPFLLPEGVTGFCLSGHKIYAPKGIGLAVVRDHYAISPLLVGGPQQLGQRAGTEDVVAIVALAKAMEIVHNEAFDDQKRMSNLRDYFEMSLQKQLPSILIQGQNELRVANTSNVSFVGADAESMVINLDLEGVCASHGAACSSGGLEPSHVLLHMGLAPEVIRGAIRFSLGRFTTKEELDQAIDTIHAILQK